MIPIVWAAFAVLAEAGTLAVLPLERSVSSEELSGLGKGLAGMITADLAGIDGLVLVERMRIDDLVSEIELGRSGLVDPATAARAGKLLGADTVLVGTFTVVERSLALDVRLVETGSARIVAGTTASGPVDDFVSVEKEVVQGVLDDLGLSLDTRAKREFFARVPTEQFDAFAAEARGRWALEHGEIEAAREAFREALAKDPEYAAALGALGEIDALSKRAAGDAAIAAAAERTALHRRVLAETVDPRAQKSPWTAAQLAGLPVRWAVLLEQGDACRRADEMLAVLERAAWRPQTLVAGAFPKPDLFRTAALAEAERLGFVRWPSARPHPDRAVLTPLADREVPMFRGTSAMLLHRLDALDDRYDAGLATSTLACRGPRGAADAIAGWQQALAAHNLLAETPHGPDGLNVGERLLALKGWFEAEGGEVTAATRRQLEALNATSTGTKQAELAQLLTTIAAHATAQTRWNLAPIGLPLAALRTRLGGLANGAPPYRASLPWCAPELDKFWRNEARRILEEWDQDEAEAERPDLAVQWAGRLVRAAGDMGCFEGVPAQVRTWPEAKTVVRAAYGRVHPLAAANSMCATRRTMIEGVLAIPDNLGDQHMVYQALDAMYVDLQDQCLAGAK